ALQSRFARRLAGKQPAGIIVGGQIAVGGGIPHAVIDAVDDAEELVGPLQEHAVQAAAEVRRLNLAGVRWADRVDQIGKDDAAFEKIDMPEELELFVIEQLPRQS